ncbi:MAG: RCC1 domain-containing protein [Solirubrobacteraceae bacterium]|nr:RCC1 domain-containing protein [Solirubrobacteraceae bacterium]
MTRILVSPRWLTAVLVALLATLAAAVPAEAKVRVGLKASASDVGVLAAVTVKGAGRAPLKVTLQRKVGGRWLVLSSGKPKRGKARLRWSSVLVAGQALRVRAVVSRGKRVVGTSASIVVKVAKAGALKPAPTPIPRPTPKPISLANDVGGGGGTGGGGDGAPAKPTTVDPPHARVAVGGEQACAVNGLFEVRCWPSNARFDEVVATKGADIKAVGSVAAGEEHACALTAKGAYCWGSNDAGQLGSDTTTVGLTTTPVGGTIGASSMVAGGDLTCINFASQAPVCWGTTPVQPGTLSTGSLPRPTTIGLGSDWKIDVITATSICARTYLKGTCFGVGGTQTPWTLDADVRRRAIGTTSSCFTQTVTVRCSGKAPTSPMPSDDLPVPTDIPGSTLIDEVATNGVTYCGVTSRGQSASCWGAPAQAREDETVWTALAVQGFND